MPYRAVTTEGSVLINNMAATRAAKEESYIAEEGCNLVPLEAH